MPKGDNKLVLNCTTELKQFMDSKKGDLERSFHCALIYLEKYKEEFIAKYGQECYDGHVKRYSIPAVELRNKANQKKQEALELKRRELDLREKELAIKIRNAENFEEQTEIAKEKTETKDQEKAKMIEFWTKKLEESKKDRNGQLQMNAERHLKELGVEPQC